MLEKLKKYDIEVVYGYKSWLRIYAKVEKKDTFFEIDKKGNIVFERGTMFENKTLPEEDKKQIIEILLNENIPEKTESDIYIRFGDLPKSGKSKNFATGEDENGISVYEARYDIMLASYEITGSALIGAAVDKMLRGEKIYLVTGEEVGTGSDGEPVIQKTKILNELEFNNGKFKIKKEVKEWA